MLRGEKNLLHRLGLVDFIFQKKTGSMFSLCNSNCVGEKIKKTKRFLFSKYRIIGQSDFQVHHQGIVQILLHGANQIHSNFWFLVRSS